MQWKSPTRTPPRSKLSHSALFLFYLHCFHQVIHAGRAPRGRGIDNWARVVDSFTGSAETLYNNAVKELKLLINCEIAGPNGVTKAFRGACPPPPKQDMLYYGPGLCRPF